MLIFDKCINYATKEYLIPLSEYGVSFSHLRQEAVKTILTKGDPIRVELVKASEAVFYFPKNELLKAINNDAMLFFIRTMLHGNAIKETKVSSSTNWDLVTDYYYGFYLAGFLLRLCLRGTLYFDDKAKRVVRAVVDAHTNGVSTFGNNCYFIANIDDNTCEYTITLVSANGGKTHELVWQQVTCLLLTLKKACVSGSDEHTVLSIIEEISNALGSNFPSKLRNKLNYHPYYAVRELNKEYSRPPRRDDWLTPILSYVKHYEDRDQSNINLVASYIHYLQQLTFCLLQKYDDLRGRDSGILSAINRPRVEKIRIPDTSFQYR